MGPPVQRRPVTIWDVIDAAERYLDEHGLERPHLAGNSMGGFVALELARRGRAQSVSAFSPAGLWSEALRARVIKRVRRATAMTRIARDIAPLVMKPPPLRRWAMRDLAWLSPQTCPSPRIAPDAAGTSGSLIGGSGRSLPEPRSARRRKVPMKSSVTRVAAWSPGS
ncbi:MAG: alpha/beta fold hydrolase [Mycobacterium sp.]